MNFKAKADEDIDVNIAPLIDVVFLLLIFFMVSTTFDHQSELSIDLPQASGDISKAENKSIDIAIDANGFFYINSKKLKDKQATTLMAELKAVSQKVNQSSNQAKVIISADKNTPHQSVMRIMDVARQLGINKLTFAAILNE